MAIAKYGTANLSFLNRYYHKLIDWLIDVFNKPQDKKKEEHILYYINKSCVRIYNNV